MFAHKCLSWIEVENTQRLREEGLYRISGSLAAITRLKEAADKDAINFIIDPTEDTHNVTGVLKMYLRDMAEPLVPYKLYSLFVEAVTITHYPKRDEAIQIVLKSLPPDNRVIFDRLFYHLHKVASFVLDNKMDSKNLALVFTPTILRPNEASLGVDIDDTAHTINFISYLIEKPDFYLHPNLLVSPRSQYTFNDLDSTSTLIPHIIFGGPPTDVPPAPLDIPIPISNYSSSTPVSPLGSPLGSPTQESFHSYEKDQLPKVISVPIIHEKKKKDWDNY